MHSLLTMLAMATAFLAALGTLFVRRLALERGVLDVPNERSSHLVPTPRGGGLAIVVALSLAVFALALDGKLSPSMMPVLVGSWAVAIIGFCDDRFQLSAQVRFLVHLAAAIWALGWLGGMPPLAVGDEVVNLGIAGSVLAVIGIVWSLNLFNFMDGIDGIAAAEAIFVCVAGALLTGAGLSSLSALSLMMAAACAGFLVWNWPPARVFMGDVGSGFIGYMIAILALATTLQNPAALFVWLILGSLFFADATVTLVRRLVRGEAVFKAHRSHAYQILARRWQSHRAVTVAGIAVNLIVVLPLAWLASVQPSWAALIAGCIVCVFGIAAHFIGAGDPRES
jgi:Fuc2NAc and GlcNAc transferase